MHGSNFSRVAQLAFVTMCVILAMGMLMLQPPYVKAATITIDGDTADWAGVSNFIDSPTDAGGGSGDITSVAITSDSNNLYIRWDQTLTANVNKIKSDGFGIFISRTANGVTDAKLWVLFNSSGIPTTRVEYPLGTLTTIGTAEQTCNVVACANGSPVSVEASVPLTSFSTSIEIIGLAAVSLATASTSSNIKDCLPGTSVCTGSFLLDLSSGSVVSATFTPTLASTNTPTATDTATSTPTATDTATSTPTATDTATSTPTATDTATNTPTNSATQTPAVTNTPSYTSTKTYTPTVTLTATITYTRTQTGTPAPEAKLNIELVDSLFYDADANGTISPGDTLIYHASITNIGSMNVVGGRFIAVPDKNSTFVIGSVTTTSGSVMQGMFAGDNQVVVDLADIMPAQRIFVSYRVVIKKSLPPRVMALAVQASVSAMNLVTHWSDDPSTAASYDQTQTIITAEPFVQVYCEARLLTDVDGDGRISPGDTVLLTVTAQNSGNLDAVNVSITDTFSRYTELQTGSVVTSSGAVEIGNRSGDTSVLVRFATLEVGASPVIITYQARITPTLDTTKIQQIAHHPSLTFRTTRMRTTSTIRTDDPSTIVLVDPTIVFLASNQRLEVVKQTMISTDANSNGNADVGDSLLYRVVIKNLASSTARNVRMNDTPDAKTRIVIGSVRTTHGTVITGNKNGDTRIRVDVGILEPSATVIITYNVKINNTASGTIVNQATVTSDSGTMSSDDPRTSTLNDPTNIQVGTRPAAITLAYLRASPHVRGALVEWHTTREEDTWRFRVHRELANGRREVVSTCASIIASGSTVRSAYYQCIDQNRKGVRYVIEEITRFGVSTFYTTVKRTR